MRTAALLFLSLLALATPCAADPIKPDRSIVSIQVLEEVAIITLDQVISDIEGCAYSNGDSVAIDLAINESLFSSVLAAATSKQKVGFLVQGCSGGDLDYPLATRVSIGY